jgi:hypothetical protein
VCQSEEEKVVKKRVRRGEVFQAPPLQQTIDIGKGQRSIIL